MDNSAPVDTFMRVEELTKRGIDPIAVSLIFQNQVGRTLDLKEFLKVSPDEEGQNIEFQTLDEISITVPVYLADGNWNKVVREK